MLASLGLPERLAGLPYPGLEQRLPEHLALLVLPKQMDLEPLGLEAWLGSAPGSQEELLELQVHSGWRESLVRLELLAVGRQQVE